MRTKLRSFLYWGFDKGMDLYLLVKIYGLDNMLTHLFPMQPFSIPWKYQKTLSFCHSDVIRNWIYSTQLHVIFLSIFSVLTKIANRTELRYWGFKKGMDLYLAVKIYRLDNILNPLSANRTKWSNTETFRRLLSTNCLCVLWSICWIGAKRVKDPLKHQW